MIEGTIGRRGVLAAAALAASGPLGAIGASALAQSTDPKVLIKTGRGSMLIEIKARQAPITAANFLRYVDAHAYDGGTFWRATRTIGAPKEGSIEAGPSLKVHRFPPIAHESTTKTGLRHITGAVSLARYAPGTATADFFICASPLPYLDAHPGAPGDNEGYAVFGQVVRGMDVVRTILALRTVKNPSFPKMTPQMLSPPVPIISMTRAT